MALSIRILVGTMTGTAQIVAEDMAAVLSDEGFNVKTDLMDDAEASVFKGGGYFIICTSTYGQGDVPDNAKALLNSLKNVKPDLSDVKFGIFGLGDSTYAETFSFGGKRFDCILNQLGAKRIGEPKFHDASAGTLPEEEAASWVVSWAKLLKSDGT